VPVDQQARTLVIVGDDTVADNDAFARLELDLECHLIQSLWGSISMDGEPALVNEALTQLAQFGAGFVNSQESA
jgi:hypothetical protein